MPEHEIGLVPPTAGHQVGDPAEVVGEVGIGHHRHLALAQRRSQPAARCHIPGGLGDHAGAGLDGDYADPSVEPLSTTMTSLRIPAADIASRASFTH